MIDVTFSDEMNSRTAASVADVLRSDRLFIPTSADYGDQKHADWVEKTEAELIAGTRSALFARRLGTAAGVIVWRPAPEPTVIDIRNISITPLNRGQLFGSFMLRAVETAIAETAPDCKIRIDTKSTNTEMMKFLLQSGYSVEGLADLYQSGKIDIIFAKVVAAHSEMPATI